MLRMKLIREPAYFNKYGVPCCHISQVKGLQVNQSDVLTKRAAEDGYTVKIGKDIYEAVRNEIKLISNGMRKSILEIGGGSGSFFDYVDKYALRYINIDPSLVFDGELVENRLKTEKYGCIQCSAEDVPLDDSSFDVIIAIDSLDHIPDVDRVLIEVSRLLKPNGYFIMSINNKGSWWKKLLSGTECLRKREELIAQEHYFQWSANECEEFLAKYFYVENIFTITYLPYIPKVWKFILPVVEIVGRRLMPRLGANLVCVAKKEQISNAQ